MTKVLNEVENKTVELIDDEYRSILASTGDYEYIIHNLIGSNRYPLENANIIIREIEGDSEYITFNGKLENAYLRHKDEYEECGIPEKLFLIIEESFPSSDNQKEPVTIKTPVFQIPTEDIKNCRFVARFLYDSRPDFDSDNHCYHQIDFDYPRAGLSYTLTFGM